MPASAVAAALCLELSCNACSRLLWRACQKGKSRWTRSACCALGAHALQAAAQLYCGMKGLLQMSCKACLVCTRPCACLLNCKSGNTRSTLVLTTKSITVPAAPEVRLYQPCPASVTLEIRNMSLLSTSMTHLSSMNVCHTHQDVSTLQVNSCVPMRPGSTQHVQQRNVHHERLQSKVPGWNMSLSRL